MASTPADTSAEAQALLDQRWESMSPADKAEIVVALFNDCTNLALAGITAQYGEMDPTSTAYHLAARRYGSDLADAVYRP